MSKEFFKLIIPDGLISGVSCGLILAAASLGCSSETFRGPTNRGGGVGGSSAPRSNAQVTTDSDGKGLSTSKSQQSPVPGGQGGGQGTNAGGIAGGNAGGNANEMGTGRSGTQENTADKPPSNPNGGGSASTGPGAGNAGCTPVSSKVSFEPYLPDDAVNGIIATTEAGTPSLTRGENIVVYGPSSTAVSHWAITKGNISTDAFCRAKGYDAGLAICKKSSENIEGILVSNLTSTVAGQARWALGCNWGVGVVRTPEAVACVTFAKSCPAQAGQGENLWINYSGGIVPQQACKNAGFSDATALCRGSSVTQKETEGTIAWNGTAAKCMYGDKHFGNVSQLLCTPKSSTSSSPHTGWVTLATDTGLNGSGTGSVPELSSSTQAFFNNFTIVGGVVSGTGGQFSFHAQNKSADEVCKSAGFSGFSGFCETNSGSGGLVQNQSTLVNGQARWASACLTGGGTTSEEMTYGIATRIQCLK